jgi:hypothetical protein
VSGLRFPRREEGAFAVMTPFLLLVILGVCGMAIDFSRMYNRKAELQTIADTIALAAAAELDGTQPGVQRAAAAAAEAATRNPLYEYNASLMAWSPAALKFSSVPSGGTWLDAGEAAANPDSLLYARVDTSKLDERHGRVNMLLLPAVSSAMSSAQITGRATAGRSSINVLPLAICAMADKLDEPGVQRGDELVEYGFRRGVSYNLMNLNPGDSAKGATYLVNPFAPPGVKGASVASRLSVIEPFICTGTMAMPRVTGGDLTVDSGFPLGSLFSHLNSRFGTYTAPCTSANAPPDTNIKHYTFADTISWMTDTPTGQSAEKRTGDKKLYTIAHLDETDIPASTTPGMYGPLWIYAKAAKYSSYISNNKTEPAGGYATLDAAADWSKLYKPGSPVLKGTYPSNGPYKTYTTSPAPLTGVADRRVLNIPLLRCPVSSGSAEVLGVGRFYMTVPATKDDLFAEFTGLARRQSLTGKVELYP